MKYLNWTRYAIIYEGNDDIFYALQVLINGVNWWENKALASQGKANMGSDSLFAFSLLVFLFVRFPHRMIIFLPLERYEMTRDANQSALLSYFCHTRREKKIGSERSKRGCKLAIP